MSRAQAAWSDACVPDLSGILTTKLGINPAALAAELEPHVREYRILRAMHDADATREESIDELAAFVRAMRAAAEALEPDRLPSRVRALMQEDIFEARHATMREFCVRAQSDLHLLADAAERVRATLAPAPKGRKSSRPRDALVATTTALLRDAGIKAVLAEALARDVLLACGVAVPVNVKRATKKGRK